MALRRPGSMAHHDPRTQGTLRTHKITPTYIG
jgi:hypothetical protein